MKMWTNIRVKIKLKKVYKFAVKFPLWDVKEPTHYNFEKSRGRSSRCCGLS